MAFDPSKFSPRIPAAVKAQATAAILKASATTAPVVAQANVVSEQVAALQAAARYWAQRNDSFAEGKAATCIDLAAKLEHFGSFISERQAAYAAKLVEWTKPRQPILMPAQAPIEAPVAPRPLPAAPIAPAVILPRLFDLMQRLAKLQIGDLTIARKNGDSLCWVKHAKCDKVVGRIDNGTLTLWQRPMVDMPQVLADLLTIEQDPEAAAVKHGKASGRCSVCSRDLTDPESIERGIGPICFGKFQS